MEGAPTTAAAVTLAMAAAITDGGSQGCTRHVRSALISRHAAMDPGGPFGAKTGSGVPCSPSHFFRRDKSEPTDELKAGR
jgi:hypothetical protein